METEKNIYPNVDFPCGLTYFTMGIPVPQYTPSSSPPASPAGPPTSSNNTPTTASSARSPSMSAREEVE